MNEVFTKKEEEYLRLLALGMSDKEIAREMGVTTQALSSGRIWGIKAKTGKNTRKEVVEYAERHFATKKEGVNCMNNRVVKFQTGKQVANTDIKRTSLYIPEDLYEKVQNSANKNRRSFNSELLWLAEQTLERDA